MTNQIQKKDVEFHWPPSGIGHTIGSHPPLPETLERYRTRAGYMASQVKGLEEI